MEYDCLRFSEIPHTTKLFASFTENFSTVKQFYSHTPDEAEVRAAANEVRLDPSTRKMVADILRDENAALGSDTATMRSIDRLAGGAVAIVTGQQAGLFAGPAYTIYKALDAIHWAKKLTQAGVEAVPIFWMATEDHDLAEANQVYFNERYGLAQFSVPVDEAAVGKSVGKIALGKAILPVVEHTASLLEGASAKEIRSAVAECYRVNEDFGSAFGKLLARLFSGSGLILLNPLDKRLHELARSGYRKALEHAAELSSALLARAKELGKHGFHAQVKVTQQSTLLFLEVDGKREPVRIKNGTFIAGELRLNSAELLTKIGNEPEAFSANALLRPVLQDSILPTVAYIGGPGEVAYMAQAQVIYHKILGRMPAILPRSSFTLIEPAVARALKKYQLEISDVFGGRQQLRQKMEKNYLPRGLAARFARDEKSLQKILSGYEKPLQVLDKSLTGARNTAEKKMLHQFEKLRGKAGRAENARSGVLDRHEAEITSALYPRHGLQERTLSLLPFLARYGTELLARLDSSMNSPCKGHRLVSL